MVKLVKYLVREGFEITVISPELHSSSKIDKSSECVELQQIKRYTVSQSNWFNQFLLKRRNNAMSKDSASNLIKSKKNKSFSSTIKIWITRLIHLMYTLIRNMDWSRQVTSFIKHNNITKYDFVLSSYPSLGAHWAASIYAKNHKEVKWIADFRDPVNYEMNSTRIGFFVYSFLQRRIVRKANLVISISKGVLNKVLGRGEFANALVYNGYDSEDIPHITTNTTNQSLLSFSYVGSLYGGERNIEVVFEVIRSLIKKQSATINQFRFEYAGAEFKVLEQMASKYKLESVLVNHGFVTREQSIKIQTSTDFVVVATWNTEKDQGILSGKIFECFMLKKPVIVVINGDLAGSELKEIVDDISAGFAIEDASQEFVEDKHKLEEFILASLSKKLLMGELKSSYNKKVEQFDYSNIVSDLSLILTKI